MSIKSVEPISIMWKRTLIYFFCEFFIFGLSENLVISENCCNFIVLKTKFHKQ